MIKLFVLIVCLLTVACTPLKHKTIDKTYHGTNCTGGYWLAWLTQDAVKDDSVVIRVTGYNVEEHIIEKQNIVAFMNGDSVTFPEVTKTPLGEKLIRVVPGKYQLGFLPSRLSLPFRTKRFHLKAGDSLTVALIRCGTISHQ